MFYGKIYFNYIHFHNHFFQIILTTLIHHNVNIPLEI